MSNRNGMKKQKLLARKQELLNVLKRIEEAHASQTRSNFYEDDSSESEVEFVINKAPSAAEKTLQQELLRTCLLATSELTGVTLLQSEVKVLIDAPTFEGEEPITEEGLWREVKAECCVDLLSFSITFYTHQPSRQFAPPSYRGLRVTPAEPVHEKELARSILPALTVPSDAVEVLCSYAQEHDARRMTLASLAEKYADLLFMEPLPEGGYLLKCADLMRVTWTLQNQRSPLSPFRHYLSLDLEYIDEPYVRRIFRAHKQLGNPALSVHRRTDLLADIIDTCLEARANGQTDDPAKSSEVMGPPKSLPKKTKPKGKENTGANERKRSEDTSETGEGTSKRERRKRTDAKNASKEKNNVRSENVYEKFSKQTKNSHSKSSGSEEGAESKNSEALKSTDDVKAKNGQTKIKSVNDKSSEKNAKTNQNEKVSEIELKTEEKIIPAEKETSNLKDKNNKGNFETRPATQNDNPNSKAVATKHVKSKAVIDENEPKTKKSKISETEKSATQNINNTETAEQRSKEKVIKNKEDEPYVRRIFRAHKQLGDPALSAHRRTDLLADIIDTCLEARANGLTDDPAKSSEVMGPPKSLPKKTKPKGKENTGANERKRSEDTSETGEGTSKRERRKRTDAKNASKEKNNVRSENVYEKFSKQTKNSHSKSSGSEEGAESKNSEALKSTDDVKAKNGQTKIKSVNDKSSEKNAKTNQNKKVSEIELKTEEKIIPAEKETSNLKDKNNKGNFETRPATQNDNPNSKAVATKHVKSKAVIDENEPKTKKSKISETEKSATQNINNTETAEQRSKEKVMKNKEDEPYVRRIFRAHKQLGDPALSAHRRTDLLADIIDTCLEARANGQTDDPAKSSEVMGPPKSLPKKTKPKGKENTGANGRKRSEDTSETGEVTSKRERRKVTDAKNASKEKNNVRSENVYEKFSKQTKNSHSKSSGSEEDYTFYIY